MVYIHTQVEERKLEGIVAHVRLDIPIDLQSSSLKEKISQYKDIKQFRDYQFLSSPYRNGRLIEFPANVLAVSEILLRAQNNGWMYEKIDDESEFFSKTKGLRERIYQEFDNFILGAVKSEPPIQFKTMHAIRLLPIYKITRNSEQGYLVLSRLKFSLLGQDIDAREWLPLVVIRLPQDLLISMDTDLYVASRNLNIVEKGKILERFFQ